MTHLFIPGPTDVDAQVLAAQTQTMIGHRGKEFEELFARLQPKLRRLFATTQRVYISTSSGTGLQEAAIRNCVERRALCCVNGAFAERWFQIALANGKDAQRLDVEWGQPITPDLVEAALATDHFDAITIVHNETSTGVISPIRDIAARIRARFPDVLILVDAVSSLGGVEIDFETWGLDVLLTSSQKCLALPPGLAFAAVSDRALDKARRVPQRGLYFDFVEWEKYLLKNQTMATPAISLLWALDVGLDRIFIEGLANRFARHARLAARTQAWASERFALFAPAPYRSPTVTCVVNTRQISVAKLNTHLRARGMQISNGYGQLKETTFRIAHMGEIQMNDLDTLFTAIEEYLAT